MDEDLAYTDVFTLRARRVPARELTAALIERIEALDAPGTPTELRSVLAISPTVTEEAERADARDARARDADARAADARAARYASGAVRRPLHGIPVLVKDNIEVEGLPSCAGATSLSGRPATRDAPLVARLRDAGAIVLGATNLSEWANIRSPRSTSGWSAVGGLTANPWALDRSAGGSSSGSGAAVAAGFAPLAVGTETDGSITCPCSLNGVAGIKPTVGSVPTGGVVPISLSQDSPGPMARTVDEVALLLEVLAATPGILERARAGTAGVRVGVARTWRTGHPGTDALFDRTVDRLRETGTAVSDVAAAVPAQEVDNDEMTVLLAELVEGMAAYLPTRGPGGPQDLAGVVAHEKHNAAVELAHFGHEFFERALYLGGTGNVAYSEARARNVAWAVQGCLQPALGECDVLVAPTYGPAWKSDLALGDHPAAASPITTAPAIAGWPIATVPMGLVDELPVGFGAVGPPGSEALLLAVCREVEQTLGGEPTRPRWRSPGRG